MAGIGRTRASVRFFGEDMDPAEISRLLASNPTAQNRPGDVLQSGHVLKRGSWRLTATELEPGDLESQIRSLLEGLTQDLAIWRELTARYQGDVFCGLFMDFTNEGAELSAALMAMLAERGLRLDFDIYAPDRKDEKLH